MKSNFINFPTKTRDEFFDENNNSNNNFKSNLDRESDFSKKGFDNKMTRGKSSIETNYTNNEFIPSYSNYSNLNLKNTNINSNYNTNTFENQNINIKGYVNINSIDDNSIYNSKNNFNIKSNFYDSNEIGSNSKMINNICELDNRNSVLNDSNYHKDYKFPFKSLFLRIVSFILS